MPKTSNTEGVPKPDETLPAELWLDIFRSIISEFRREYAGTDIASFTRLSDYKGGLASSKGQRIPITLSHVCRSWHDLITSHPPFWSHIYVMEHQRCPSKTLDIYLARSGSMDLFFWTDATREPTWMYREQRRRELDACFQALKGVSSRWKLASFNLCNATWAIWNRVFPPDCYSTMDLVGLDTIEMSTRGKPVYESISRFSTASNLPNIRMGDRVFSLWMRRPKTPTNVPFIQNIRSLAMGSYTMWEVYQFVGELARIPRLETLELYNIPTSSMFPFAEPALRIILPNLIKLVITGWNSMINCRAFLQYVNLPALKHVVMAPKFRHSCLTGMLGSSRSQLQSLTLYLDEEDSDDGHLEELLACPAMDELQELTLVHPPGMQSKTINPTPNSEGRTPSPFPPSLISLTIIGWNSDDGDLTNWVPMVRGGTLRHLYVEVFEGKMGSHEKDAMAIRDLQRSGCDVHFRQRTLVQGRS